MPPVKYCSISKSDLFRKFTEENWQNRLDAYVPETIIYSRKTIRIWKSGNIVMGIITWHTNPNGVEMVVRMIRECRPDGDVIWDIDHNDPGKQLSLPLSTTKEQA